MLASEEHFSQLSLWLVNLCLISSYEFSENQIQTILVTRRSILKFSLKSEEKSVDRH